MMTIEQGLVKQALIYSGNVDAKTTFSGLFRHMKGFDRHTEALTKLRLTKPLKRANSIVWAVYYLAFYELPVC